MYLGENIRFLRKTHNMNQTELSKELGYKSFTTIQKWEDGSSDPPLSTLLRLCELFSVDLEELTHARLFCGEAIRVKSESVRVPVLGKVAAGVPMEAVENILDYEEIPAELSERGEYFGLRIQGASMAPRIQEGDTVIVRKQDDADSGETAIILVNGADATCKKIKKTDDGLLMIPLNPNYEPIFYSGDEIRDLPVRIIGKVVELRGKL
ncbi:MAG: LexA family protein [Bacillota bacterium]|jgi:repressor LexA